MLFKHINKLLNLNKIVIEKRQMKSAVGIHDEETLLSLCRTGNVLTKKEEAASAVMRLNRTLQAGDNSPCKSWRYKGVWILEECQVHWWFLHRWSELYCRQTNSVPEEEVLELPEKKKSPNFFLCGMTEALELSWKAGHLVGVEEKHVSGTSSSG